MLCWVVFVELFLLLALRHRSRILDIFCKGYKLVIDSLDPASKIPSDTFLFYGSFRAFSNTESKHKHRLIFRAVGYLTSEYVYFWKIDNFIDQYCKISLSSVGQEKMCLR